MRKKDDHRAREGESRGCKLQNMTEKELCSALLHTQPLSLHDLSAFQERIKQYD